MNRILPHLRRRPVPRPLCAALLLAVAAVALAAAPAPTPAPAPVSGGPSVEQRAGYRRPIITAPLLPAAPRIDGSVDRTEWLPAAQGAPLTERNSALATDEVMTWWIGYTPDAVHLAFRLERPRYAVTPAPEDRVELFLGPGDDGIDYTFVLDAKGNKTEGRRDRSTDHTWSGPWSAAVRNTDIGWEGEMTIPLSTLGVTSGNPAGRVWRMLFFSNRRTPTAQQAMSAYLRDWPAKQDHAFLRFGDPAAPAVRVLSAGPIIVAEAGLLLEVLRGDSTRRIEVDAALYQSTGSVRGTVTALEGGDIIVPKDIELNFFQMLDSMPLEDVLKNYRRVQTWREELTPEPAGKRLRLAETVDPGRYLLVYRVMQGGSTLLSGALPFVQRAAFAVTVEPYLLTAGSVLVTTEYRRFEGTLDGAAIEARLSDSDNKPLGQARAFADSKTRRTVLSIPMSDAFGKPIRVLTRLTLNNRVLAEDNQTLALPDKPQWLGNTIGKTNDPLPPWKPIELSDDTASVLLRDITLGPSGLPAALLSRQRQLLARPIDLLLAGKPLTWKRQLVSQHPGQIVWSAQAQSGSVNLTLKTTLEYDGMLRYDLTLDPGAQSASIRDLALVIPYEQTAAQFLNDLPLDKNLLPKFTAFQPQMTLSDMTTGLQWFAEWAKGWQIGAQPVFEFTLDRTAVLWQTRLIGQEGQALRQPLTLTFGLMPLPARELDLKTYNTVFRHSQPYPAQPWPADEATCTLEYPLKDNLDKWGGSLAVRASFYEPARIFQIGQGEFSVNLYYANGPYNQRRPELWLTYGEAAPSAEKVEGQFQKLAVISSLVRHSDTWQPLFLTWRRVGDKVQLQLGTEEPPANSRTTPAELPWAQWELALEANILRLGGQGTIAIDQILAMSQAQPADELADSLGKLASFDGVLLADDLDKTRFHQGKYLTRPAKITLGRGGIAGGKYSGLFVQRVPGRMGQALLLPSGPRTGYEVMRAYGFGMTLPIHEQFTPLAGYYTVEHMPSPVLRERYRQTQSQGIGVLMYGGFGINGEADAGVHGVAHELILPGRQVGASQSACFATPAVDYYVDAWQRNIDYYHAAGGMYDNTVNCRDQCTAVEHGCGWTDDKGVLRGRYPIFGARELAKRLRYLWKVHRPQTLGQEGLFILHAGARGFHAVDDFPDVIKFGEGWVMGSKFELQEPEKWWRDGWQWRLGVPGEILPKTQSPFSHNWLLMYSLLYGQPCRFLGSFFHPQWWYVDSANPANPQPQADQVLGQFNPYFSREGVPAVAAPFALWWQLQDDFDTHDAQFIPFWSTADLISLNHPKLRSSFYLHRGKSALFIVANFDPANVEAQLDVDWARLELAGRLLHVYDAWTGEDYGRLGQSIRLPIPGWQYRIIRVEAQ